MDVIVKCGNGGDWEWYNEQELWKTWIAQNIPGAKFKTGCEGYCKADELLIRFENPHHATMFNLKRPFYISYEDTLREKNK